MKKLIIIYGWHLDKVQIHTSEERLIKILNSNSFNVSDDLGVLNIVVYKSPLFSEHNKLTHVVIGFGDEITDIKYYINKI